VARASERCFNVGDWLVEPELDRITRESESNYLRPQVMELLIYLARNPNRVVSAEELLADLWTGKVVTGGNVYNCVAELRQALADGEDPPAQYIETIPKKGYRLVAPVTDSETELQAPSTESMKLPSGSSRSNLATIAGLAALGVAVTIVLLVFLTRIPPTNGIVETAPVRRFTIELPRSMPDFGRAYSPVLISSNGEALLFGGDVDEPSPIRLRRFGDFNVTEITGTEDAAGVFALSPKGDSVAFVDNSDGLIKKVPIDGGVPATICDPEGKVWGMAWGPDGSIVYETGSYSGLMWVDAQGDAPQRLTSPGPDETHKHPSFSVDGDVLFYSIGERGSTTRKTDRVAALSLRSGRQAVLLSGSSPVATPGNHLMFYRDRALWIANFRKQDLSIIGEALTVAKNVHYESHAHYGLAGDGTLVYVDDGNLDRRHLIWVDRNGNETAISRDPMPFIAPRLSPDGSRIAVIIDSDEGADLWIYSLARGTMARLTHDESREASPVWSHDGSFIVYSSNRVDDLFRVSAYGSPSIEQLTSSPKYQFAYSLTPDDRQVFFSEGASNTSRVGDIMTLLIGSEERPAAILASEFSEYQPAISPDGEWLAYTSDRSGTPEVYVRPYPDLSDYEIQISIDGGTRPRWAHDGSAIVYVGPTDLMITEIELASKLRAVVTKPLIDLAGFEYDFGNFDISLDGQRFLMVKALTDAEFPVSRVVVVQNWLDDATQRISQGQ